MTEEKTSEYSDKINFNDWPDITEEGTPVDWTLDRKDEKQVEANIDSLEMMKRYLERKRESLEAEKRKLLKSDNQEDSTPTEEQQEL